EAAPKPADSGKAYALDLDCLAVEHRDSSLFQNLAHQFRLARFEIVIAKHADHRHPDGTAQIDRQFFGFLRQTVVSQIAAQEQDVGLMRNVSEHIMQFTARMFPVMDIRHGCDPELCHPAIETAAWRRTDVSQLPPVPGWLCVSDPSGISRTI